MSKATKRGRSGYPADLLMIALCCTTSFFVLASPLVPYVFDLNTAAGFLTFLGTDLLLSTVLSGIGISLNHRAGVDAPLFRRRRE